MTDDVIDDEDTGDQWQHIAKVIAPLVAEVEARKRLVEVAYFYGLNDLADAAHAGLICARWKLIQAERRAGLG